MLTFIWFQGETEAFKDAALVRKTVFVEEQKFSLTGEFDTIDAQSWHVVGYEGEEAVCTARMYKEENGYHVGRVAVLQQCRGKKVGLQLMQAVNEKAKLLGAEYTVLNAQHDKADFYLKAGYTLTGKTLLDEGYPHVEMKCILQ